MAELKLVAGSTYVVGDMVTLGVFVKPNRGCVLIDSGTDKDSARLVLKLLRDNGLFVEDIINTHAHADHCGGNAYLTSSANATPRGPVEVYASREEAPFIEHPWIEPLYFYCGAAPISELKHKFVEATPSKVAHVFTGKDFTIAGHAFQAIPLPGHTPGMTGIMTEDNVMFCGDALFSEQIIAKHGLPYYTNVRQAMESLSKLQTLGAQHYVLAHGGQVDNISVIAQANINAALENHEVIYNGIAEGTTIEGLVRQAYLRYPTMRQAPIPYFMTKTIVMAHLTKMQEDKRIRFEVRDGALTITKL